MPPDSIEPFVLFDQRIKTIQEKGVVRNIYQFKFAPFATGELVLPQFNFLVQDSAKIDTLRSNILKIDVKSVMPEGMKEINDIKEAIEFPNPLPFIILIIFIIGGAISFLGFRILKRYKVIKKQIKPPVPPWEEALFALDKLLKNDLIGKGLIKKLYYELSEIIKRYLEARFQFPALEQTTSEILHTMKTKKIPFREEFNTFFLNVDPVKYTKFVPSQDEIQKTIFLAKGLIEKTMPKEEVKG